MFSRVLVFSSRADSLYCAFILTECFLLDHNIKLRNMFHVNDNLIKTYNVWCMMILEEDCTGTMYIEEYGKLWNMERNFKLFFFIELSFKLLWWNFRIFSVSILILFYLIFGRGRSKIIFQSFIHQLKRKSFKFLFKLTKELTKIILFALK